MRSVGVGSKMSPMQKAILAGKMAAYARKIIGESDLWEPSTWRVALRRIGCDVILWRDAKPEDVAQFFAIPEEVVKYPLGFVRYNPYRQRRTCVRGLAHEFGHALCQQWIPEMVFDADTVYSYHDDPRSTRHQIARLFEKLMVG